MITIKQKLNDKRGLLAAGGILFSGLCWYLSNGLRGDFWFLLWIAPVPVLIISFRTRGWIAFVISFLAYLLGRFSWFSYLITVATVVPAVIITIVLPLFFALVIVFTRRIVIKTNAWYSVFAFPVFFTAYEFLVTIFSADGTAGSIAYSQCNFLPVVQVASLTGILGITFLLTLLPSVIAVGWYYGKRFNNMRRLTGIPALVIISAFLFGILRINRTAGEDILKVGLVVLPEKSHIIADVADPVKEMTVAVLYEKLIARLAAKGSELIVLPERAVNIDKDKNTALVDFLGQSARQKQIYIVTGYTNIGRAREYNSSLVFSNEGVAVADYNKVHLVTGLERQFTRGNETGLFNIRSVQAGTAICKDLDFPNHIRKYGKRGISFLCVPAWDFVKDDWLHSRMAIMRGVENGFSEIRTARKGRLTISDCFGRVPFEANASDGQLVTLHGEISLKNRHTIYTRYGDWFGIINLIAALVFIVSGIRVKRKENAS